MGVLTPGRDGTELAVYCLHRYWECFSAALSLTKVVTPKNQLRVVAPNQLLMAAVPNQLTRTVAPKQLPRVITPREPTKHPLRAVIPKRLSRVAPAKHYMPRYMPR